MLLPVWSLSETCGARDGAVSPETFRDGNQAIINIRDSSESLNCGSAFNEFAGLSEDPVQLLLNHMPLLIQVDTEYAY